MELKNWQLGIITADGLVELGGLAAYTPPGALRWAVQRAKAQGLDGIATAEDTTYGPEHQPCYLLQQRFWSVPHNYEEAGMN